MKDVLALVPLALMLLGIYGLIRERITRVGVKTRKGAGLLLLAGFALAVIWGPIFGEKKPYSGRSVESAPSVSQETQQSYRLESLPKAIPLVPKEAKRMNALEKMAIAFEGGYSKEKIETSLDKAMRLYELPISEEHYERAGSVLVALREQNGFTEKGIAEMDILDYMIRSHVPGVSMSFPDAAAFAVSFLAAGDN